MASYQDLETRTITLEQQMDFLLTFLRQNIALNTGVLGPDGKPQVKRTSVTFADLYRGIKNGDIKVQPPPVESSALPPPTPSGQEGVGPDVGYESPAEPPANFDFPPDA